MQIIVKSEVQVTVGETSSTSTLEFTFETEVSGTIDFSKHFEEHSKFHKESRCPEE